MFWLVCTYIGDCNYTYKDSQSVRHIPNYKSKRQTRIIWMQAMCYIIALFSYLKPNKTWKKWIFEQFTFTIIFKHHALPVLCKTKLNYVFNVNKHSKCKSDTYKNNYTFIGILLTIHNKESNWSMYNQLRNAWIPPWWYNYKPYYSQQQFEYRQIHNDLKKINIGNCSQWSYRKCDI